MENLQSNNLLRQSVAQQWPAAKAGRFAVEVGLSGGVDSVVLLHILCSLRNDLPMDLSAVHVHHGISHLADGWADFCRGLCDDWQVSLRVEHVQLEYDGLGIEAAARAARYRCYADSRADAVALAHHANDQVETLMLAVLRGSGLRSLASMPSLRALNERVSLWRPLLPFSRPELIDYARAHYLRWIEDNSNTDTSLLRNWLRLQGLPPWRERIPHLDRQLLATVKQLQRDLALLEEYTNSEHDKLYHADKHFQVALWQQLGPLRQTHQLHAFSRRQGLGSPSADSVRQFAATLSDPSVQQAEWPLPKGKAVLYAGRLFAVPATWKPGTLLVQPSWHPARHGLPENLIQPDSGYWRTPKPGDTLPLPNGNKKITRLLQEKKIPPFMRASWPLWISTQHGCLAAANLQTHYHLSVPKGWQAQAEALSGFILANAAYQTKP